MNSTWRYAAVTGLLVAATSGAGAMGFVAANYAFAPKSRVMSVDATVKTPVSQAGRAGKVASPLVGATAAESKAAMDAAGRSDRTATESAKDEWVEVVDAVNMRSGASSAKPVIKVQLEGTRLRVAARDGGWVKVVEPDTGEEGWVYGKYVE